MSSNEKQRRALRALCAALGFGASAAICDRRGRAGAELGLEEITVIGALPRGEPAGDAARDHGVHGENMEARNLTDVTMLDSSPRTRSFNRWVQDGARPRRRSSAAWGSATLVVVRARRADLHRRRVSRPAAGAILDLLDLERVEILRGPQGTLSARTPSAGRFGSYRAPQGDDTGYAEVTAGTFDRLDVRGSYDIALVPDKLFARFSGSSKQRDGYFDILDFECVNGPGSLGGGGTGILPGATHTTFGIPLPLPPTAPVDLHSQLGPQTFAPRRAASWTNSAARTSRPAERRSLAAGDTVEVNFSLDLTEMDQQGPSDKYTFFNPNHNFNINTSNSVMVPIFNLPYDTRFLTDGPYTSYHRFGSDPLFNRDVQNVNQMDHWGVATTVDWELTDNVQFKSITSYREFENTFGRDSDGTPLPVDHTWDTSIHDQFTQEFQITGLAADGRLDWATGFFYYDAEDSNQGWNFLYPFILSTNNHKDVQTIESAAVFVHGTYDINDVLSITAGVRYTDDQKDVNVFRQDFRTGVVIIPNTRVSVDATETSPKIGLDWELNDNLMTYVQWATGFRGGGFGPRPAEPAAGCGVRRRGGGDARGGC